MNKPLKFDVILEPQTDGGYTVYVPDLPGCVSEGRTADEALTMIQDAISGYLAVREERGLKLPAVQHRKVTVIVRTKAKTPKTPGEVLEKLIPQLAKRKRVLDPNKSFKELYDETMREDPKYAKYYTERD